MYGTSYPTIRYEVVDSSTKEKSILYHDPKVDLENVHILNSEPLIDWLMENYSNYGCNLEFVSDETPEGTQFCIGFGGLAAVLRFQIELPSNWDYVDEDNDYEWEW